jgi:hypothetical protein
MQERPWKSYGGGQKELETLLFSGPVDQRFERCLPRVFHNYSVLQDHIFIRYNGLDIQF